MRDYQKIDALYKAISLPHKDLNFHLIESNRILFLSLFASIEMFASVSALSYFPVAVQAAEI